jgi:hypothetical protein
VIRLLAPLTIVLGVLTVLITMLLSMVAVPLALATIITGFGWYVERPWPAKRNGLCGGCSAGCVECRERIELKGAS